MLALWRTLHFPFPRSISLQTNKWFFFSFLPFPSLAFPPATLQPNIYIYIYIEHFLPIVFINHCIEYGVVQELTKPFIYLFMYFLERWKWNTWWRKWGLPMYFKGFDFSNAKKKKKKKKASYNGLSWHIKDQISRTCPTLFVTRISHPKLENWISRFFLH